jgi:prevent-host-death family protein
MTMPIPFLTPRPDHWEGAVGNSPAAFPLFALTETAIQTVLCTQNVLTKGLVMIQVNSREARRKLAELLSAAQAGQTVEVTRHGRAVARIVPPSDGQRPPLPDLAKFRASLGKSRRSSKATIDALRKQDRY